MGVSLARLTTLRRHPASRRLCRLQPTNPAGPQGRQPARAASCRTADTQRAPGPGLRRLAEAATRPRLAQVSPRREARLYRPPLGRPPALTRRQPRRDGQQCRRKSRPADCPESQERVIRGSRRRRRRMGAHRFAHRDREAEPRRALRIAQGHSRSHRSRSSQQSHRRLAPLELQASVKLKAGCFVRIVYTVPPFRFLSLTATPRAFPAEV